MGQTFQKKSIQLGLGVIVVALFVALDQWSKQLAKLHLKNAPSIPIIKGVFELSYLENRGAAFGILQGQKYFLIVITIATLALMSACYVRMPKDNRYRFLRLILILFLSGAVGNLIDRLAYDYVIDFFYFKQIDFPVFNLADVYVSIAAVLFLFSCSFYYKEEEMELIFRQIAFWKKKEKR